MRRPCALMKAIHAEVKGAYGHAMRDKLVQFGMTASMSRKANCWDNAPTESFFNSLKNERVHGTRYATRAYAEADLFQYIKVFCDRGAATPRWATARRLSSFTTGSASMTISSQRRHKSGPLESENQRASGDIQRLQPLGCRWRVRGHARPLRQQWRVGTSTRRLIAHHDRSDWAPVAWGWMAEARMPRDRAGNVDHFVYTVSVEHRRFHSQHLM